MEITDHQGLRHPADSIEQIDELLNGARILRAKLMAYARNNPALKRIDHYTNRLLEYRLRLMAEANDRLAAQFTDPP